MTATTVNVDAGGTFTDGYVTRDGETVTAKVPTTAHDLTVCFVDCIEAAADKLEATPPELLGEADVVRFSTTVGTNTVIEKTGPRLGVIVTAGHEDDCYAPEGQRRITDAFVREALVEGIDERVSPDGEVVSEPDPGAVTDAVKRLQSNGARLIAIALSNSAANPANERAVKAAIDGEYPRHYLGAVPTLAASEVTDRPGDYRRLNTAAANAYVHRAMKRALYRAEDKVRDRGYDRPLFVGHSDGGVARVAKTVALNTYNSGPAAGVLGGAAVSELYGEDVVTADMGGTSIDLSVVRDGEADRQLSPAVDGLPTHISAINVHTAGAGGGSVASVAGDGSLSVGPESAGANPGPACFGRGGTEATVTDADVVLGRINPDYFLGGDYALEADRAREVIRREVAEPLDVAPEEAAARVVRRAETTIAEAVADLAPGIGTLLSYGGAGPTHAAGVAADLDVGRVIVTPYSSVFSAFGESTMNVQHAYTRAVRRVDDLDAALEAMRAEAVRDMRAEGFGVEEISFGVDAVLEDREDVRRLGYPPSVDGVSELPDGATLRLHAVGPVATPGFERHDLGAPDPADARVDSRDVWWEGEARRTPIYRRERLRPGNEIDGPAVVEAADTTVAVPPDSRLRVNEYRHVAIE